MKRTAQYQKEIVDQFVEWQGKKSPYLWRRRVETALPHLPAAGTVLEAGCGDSSTIEFFRKHRPDLAFFATDLSRLGFDGFVRADVQQLPFRTASFDGVTLLAVVEHVPDQDGLLAEVARLLKPGGIVLITTPNPLFGIPMAIAGRLGLKYKEGYDNGVSLGRLGEIARRHGMTVEEAFGFLALPFAWGLEALEEPLGSHRLGRRLLMNQFLKARKRGRP